MAAIAYFNVVATAVIVFQVGSVYDNVEYRAWGMVLYANFAFGISYVQDAVTVWGISYVNDVWHPWGTGYWLV